MRKDELEHEIPSANELLDYVLCKLEDSPFVGLIPELPLSPDREQWSGELFAFAEVGGTSFGRLAVDTLLRAHERLNALPRSDSFWENTNRRPTQFKITDFCNRLLSSNPHDVDALRTLAVLQSVHYQNDFGQRYWARLIALGEETSRIPTLAALLTALFAYRSAAQWAAFILQVERVDEGRPLVEAFAESSNERIAGWGRRAIRALRILSHRRP